MTGCAVAQVVGKIADQDVQSLGFHPQQDDDKIMFGKMTRVVTDVYDMFHEH